MHRRDVTSAAAPLDPQNLTLREKVGALIALGRIPLASEVPIWCLFGCLLSSQVFPIENHPGSSGVKSSILDASPFRNYDPWTALQCALIVWGTNISINYGNEYFDYDMDRPGMVSAIMREVKVRRNLQAKKDEIEAKVENGGKNEEEVFEVDALIESQENAKIMGSTTRIIHDGTFPPYASLLCSVFVQVLLLLLIVLSRHFDDYDPNSTATTLDSGVRPRVSPFRGAALHIGLICTFLSHTYVGPPLRLHYNGYGELISALFLSPVSALFGLVGHYTAVSGKPLSFSDLTPSNLQPWIHSASNDLSRSTGFSLDNQLVTLLLAFYFYEQARILIMHIHDINADRRGGKITMTVRLGFTRARRLYVALNIVAIALFSRLVVQFGRIALSSDGSSKLAGYGSLNRIAGHATTGQVARFRAAAWVAGILGVMAFAIPVMAITAKSLRAIDPSIRKETEAVTTNGDSDSKRSPKDNRNGEAIKGNVLRERLTRNRESKAKGATNNASNRHVDGDDRPISAPRESPRSSPSSRSGILNFIPVLPHEVLAKIVSLQMLLTPLVLSISLAIGVDGPSWASWIKR